MKQTVITLISGILTISAIFYAYNLGKHHQYQDIQADYSHQQDLIFTPHEYQLDINNHTGYALYDGTGSNLIGIASTPDSLQQLLIQDNL